MNFIQKIEFRTASFTALLAFFLSPIIGIVSGIPLLLIVIRTVLLSILFGGVGYGTFFILKRYVPEIYEILGGSESGAEQNPEEIVAEIPDEDGEALSEESEELDEGSEIKPDTGDFAPGLDSTDIVSTSSLSPASSGIKMGRHILEEKGIKYEPKIMAEAIRTMMSKDE